MYIYRDTYTNIYITYTHINTCLLVGFLLTVMKTELKEKFEVNQNFNRKLFIIITEVCRH